MELPKRLVSFPESQIDGVGVEKAREETLLRLCEPRPAVSSRATELLDALACLRAIHLRVSLGLENHGLRD
jgi:hypothetical protein